MRNARRPQGQDRRPEWARLHRAFAFIVVCWLLAHPASQAFLLQGQSAEYPVKLAFLYNFTKFVEWPAESYEGPSAPLNICIVGQDPFSLEIESQLRTRRVVGHPIQVQRLKSNDRLRGCHMVFIPGSEKVEQEKLVRDLMGSSILTVGESEGFAALGGIINLKVEGDQLRFEVNQRAADRARLKISSKMLSLAKIVN
jgi:hypothetical protein